MGFEVLDSKTLDSFAKKNGLVLSKEFKETPVRSFLVVDDNGESYQIWIEVTGNEIEVSAWDFKSQKWSQKGKTSQLGTLLDLAYAKTLGWINSRGHGRVPVR